MSFRPRWSLENFKALCSLKVKLGHIWPLHGIKLPRYSPNNRKMLLEPYQLILENFRALASMTVKHNKRWLHEDSNISPSWTKKDTPWYVPKISDSSLVVLELLDSLAVININRVFTMAWTWPLMVPKYKPNWYKPYTNFMQSWKCQSSRKPKVKLCQTFSEYYPVMFLKGWGSLRLKIRIG